MFVLVSYDVPADRTAKFRKLLKSHLGHEQFSVFFGDLPESSLIKLRDALRKLLKPGDRVLEITAANRHNVDVRCWDAGGTPAQTEDKRHTSNAVII